MGGPQSNEIYGAFPRRGEAKAFLRGVSGKREKHSAQGWRVLTLRRYLLLQWPQQRKILLVGLKGKGA